MGGAFVTPGHITLNIINSISYMYMVSNQEIRNKTKERALVILSLGNMDFTQLCAKLTEFNGWRRQTNRNIVMELIDLGKIERVRNLVLIPEKDR